ncbi:MAG TPA: aldolase/citrate lyase family protein [Kofleriaceae bacterium]|nr:aldolase/citrate lyase family protein [Kofleriaceae bacterium]
MLYADAALAFQERARSGKVCLGVHTSAMSPQLVELYGLVGLDYVIIATEVESIDINTIENLCRAANASGTVPIVKIRWPDVRLIQDAMTCGAPMLMVPHVTTRAQVDEAIRAASFEPKGLRGMCPVARYAGYGALGLGEARERVNASRPVIPIIEDEEALGRLDEIMSVPDVDIFEIGPFDLSQALGLARPELSYGNPETMAAVEKICETARKYNKAILAPLWVTPETDSPARLVQWNLEQLVPRGITLLYGLEVVMLARMFRELLPAREGFSARR